MPRKKSVADLEDKPKKKVASKTTTTKKTSKKSTDKKTSKKPVDKRTVKKSTDKKKPANKKKTATKKTATKKSVASSSGKPKIKIKKVAAKSKSRSDKDDSIVNLREQFSDDGVEEKEIAEEEIVDEGEAEVAEELSAEDMDFDWDDLLDNDSEDKPKKKKKVKKKNKTSGLGKVLPFLHKSDKTDLVDGKKHDIKSSDEDYDDEAEAEPVKKHKKSKQGDKSSASHKKRDKKSEVHEEDIIQDLPASDHYRGLSMKVYRKLAVGFVLLAVILIGIIFYFSFVKATIVLKLKDETVDQALPVSVYSRGEDYILPEDAVRGIIKEIELEQSKFYDVVGNEVIGEEVTGTVTIINDYVKNQPLVATTRLLSTEGKLFRLKNSVNVPAGKSLIVEVYADESNQEMVVGDDQFIIPGLWEGLQDKIYAESQAGDITFKKKLKKIVKQEEIDSALADLRETLIEKAKFDINDSYGNYNQKLYQINEDDISYEVEAEVGDEMDKFNVTMQARILVVAFDDAQIYDIAQTALTNNLPDNKKLLGLRPEQFTYELLEVDLERDIAEIESNFQARIAFKSDQDIINKEQIINLDRNQLAQYLENMEEIDTYDVKIVPSFINKTPSLVDRIKIEIIN